MTIAAAIALALLSPTTIARPTPPTEPPALALPFISEASRAGLSTEMFDRPVKPQATLISLFSTDDYPLESIRNMEEGTVTVILRIGKEGQLSDCIVDQSSGHPSLDSQTCRIFWRRARFEPARDKRGQPVESAWRQRIKWELPPRDPVPIKPWSMRVTIEFIRDGGVLDCQVEATGAMKADQTDCTFFRNLSGGILTKIRADSGYDRQKFIMVTQFSPSPSVPTLPAPAGTILFSRQVARLTIDASGKPLQCRVIDTEGTQPPVEGCPDLLDEMYEKPGITIGAVEVTLARTLFISD